MRMTLADLTLAGLLAGATPAPAQSQAPALPDQTQVLDCNDTECRKDGQLVFRLNSRSYLDPVTVGTNRQSSSQALEPDRRVTVSTQGAPPAAAVAAPGQADLRGRFSLILPDGGVIWASEDPDLGQPQLAVSAPGVVAFDGIHITAPVPFVARGNYPDFIQRLEVSVYRGTDTDLTTPLATIPLKVAAVTQAQWDGALPGDAPYSAGDQLVYVLRAYGADGSIDETYPQSLQLVRPEDAARSTEALRDATESTLGAALTSEQAQTQSLLQAVFSGSGLRQQNIPIHGSRIRIQGRSLPRNARLQINGDNYPVDETGTFAAEFLAPVGRHSFDVQVDGLPEQPPLRQSLDVNVTGRYFFGVGLADLTFTHNDVSGSTEPFASDPRYLDSTMSDGRLAFYVKGKLKGKYLVTAQADTTEQDLGHLFDGFGQANPQDIFRELDPNLYYPTYGDDSTTTADVDTMGRFYARVDWDKNQALWGNYATGFTGTEYAQYTRSLYGAALNWRSNGANLWGDPNTEVRAFGSQAQTAPAHNEFLGTGGSLYYLKHAEIVPGSDVVTLEIRDTTTGLVQSTVTLQRGSDYEINTIQGRIMLTRSLTQLTQENLPTLTRDTPAGGYEQWLNVDYEWVPTDFNAGQATAGFRGKHWFGNHIGLGATYVGENQDGDDYRLYGGDLTLQAGKGTYLKGEYAKTEALASPTYLSTDGGLSFARLGANAPREGAAKSIDARANLRELGWTKTDWSLAAWWHDTDAGYSTTKYSTGLATSEYGAEVLGNLTTDLRLYARYSNAENGLSRLEQLQTTLDWRIDEKNSLSGEVRSVQQGSAVTNNVTGLLGALKYTRRVTDLLDVYAQGQLTLDDDHGQYADNDLALVGAHYLFHDQSSLQAELSSGDRGNALQVSGEYKLTPDHSIYGGYTFSTDTTEYDPLLNPNRQNGWTIGQRWRISNRINLYNESQSLTENNQSGLVNTFGLDFYPATGWTLGGTLQSGDLFDITGQLVNRHAISFQAGRTSPDTDWHSKLEWLRDTGAQAREQWVSTNRLSHKINESWRVAGWVNYSDTQDKLNPLAGATFLEANVGFAWRPWNSIEWGVFGRYTYLYDLAPLYQEDSDPYDQKTQVVSLEGVHKIDQHWELALKAAVREGQARMGRGTGEWFDASTGFLAGQARYQFRAKWHALAEYRLLDVKDGGAKNGFLVGIDYDLTQNFRVGVGYNFTDFSDDLTKFGYKYKGFYINLVGSY